MTVSILGMKYKISYETSEQMKGELGMCRRKSKKATA